MHHRHTHGPLSQIGTGSRRNRIIMGVLVVMLLGYWFTFSYFVSSSTSDDTGGSDDGTTLKERGGAPFDNNERGWPRKKRDSEIERDKDSWIKDPDARPVRVRKNQVGGWAPNVSFSLDVINRSPEERNKGNTCVKEICHQQCDPLCKQYPQQLYECSQPPCEEGEDWLIYETELEYPLFHVPMPNFADEADRRFFLQSRPIAVDYGKKHTTCPSPVSKKPEPRCALVEPFDPKEKLIFSGRAFIRGHVAVIKDGVYNGRPDDTFDENSKCAYSSDYHWISPGIVSKDRVAKLDSSRRYDKLLVLMMSVTGGAFFQHFVDRGLSIITQAWSMIESDPELKLLVSPVFNSHPIVPQLYERLGLKDRLVYVKDIPLVASKMYFSCVSPHYHPYVYQKARDILRIDKFYPIEKRDTLVYLSRKDVSRKVLNEDDVLEAIRNLLDEKKHEREYRLEVFNHKNYKHANDTIEFFNKHARALIGPHGGAHYNQLFCASNTLIVEFFPFYPGKDNLQSAVRWPEAVWWPAMFMDHDYYVMPAVGNGDITVDISKLLSILKKELW